LQFSLLQPVPHAVLLVASKNSPEYSSLKYKFNFHLNLNVTQIKHYQTVPQGGYGSMPDVCRTRGIMCAINRPDSQKAVRFAYFEQASNGLAFTFRSGIAPETTPIKAGYTGGGNLQS
jgi:hypothetical protein